MSHQDVESLRRIYDAFSRWDVEELVGDLAHDIEWSLPDTLPWGGMHHGHDGVLAFASVSQDHVEGRWPIPMTSSTPATGWSSWAACEGAPGPAARSLRSSSPTSGR